MLIPRTIVWFSCGAASAVCASLVTNAEVVYCDSSAEEHPDNQRFRLDVEKWIGRPIHVIQSNRFASISEVFEQTRYMSGPQGARCTVEIKKIPRFTFQRPDDIHVFGYTIEEIKRRDRLLQNNPELYTVWPLIERGMSKKDCLTILKDAGIEIPVLYRLGYKNNNCIGCVKASSSKYWNSIRRDFPEMFAKRAKQSREIGCRLVYFKGKRLFLDELPANIFSGKDEDLSCGPQCAT